jgi:hypothetical protein
MRLFCLNLCALLVLSCATLFAQTKDNQLINVDFTNASIVQIVTDLELKTGAYFYYDPSAMDSIAVTLKLEQKTLPFILNEVFKNTSIGFAIQGQTIFLTKNTGIKVDLADGYYSSDPSKKNLASTLKEYEDMDQVGAIKETIIANKVYEVGIKTNEIKQGSATLAGYLRDQKSGEPLVGASIYSNTAKVGAISDQFGFYALTMPRGPHSLLIKATGNRDTRRQIILYSDGKMNVELQEQIYTLKQVKVSAEKRENVKSLEMGVNRLDINTIKRVPSVFGEPDILRVVLTLPGVQSVGEASTGFNVRGGSADQNLILLNDATIYNPSHFFGFFSAFNPEIVKDVQLYKSTIPQKFGGRLSSVLEVTNREGNKKKFTGSAGIGLITSRLNIEGPIDSNKTSFILGARTTYSNWLLKLLPQDYKQSRASFTDANLGISHQFNEKNSLYLSGYYSKDSFKLNSDTTYGYNNKNFGAKWKHDFNNKLYGVLSVGTDHYSYNIKSDANPVNAYKLDFDINQVNFKTDFVYNFSNDHIFDFGISSIHYKLRPGSFLPNGPESLVIPDVVEPEQALESAIYIGDKYDIGNNLSISAGLRYSFFNYLGPQSLNTYAPNLPVTEGNVTGVITYAKNKLIKTYHGPEIRASARYNFAPDFSVKASYNTLRQYIHLLSNTTAIAPTDIWKLSDPNIKPQFGSQVSLGFYKNFKGQTIETSIEGYYKNLNDFLDYKSGANLILNNNIETDVISTNGKAYGIEFFVKKNTGKLNGWMSYAFSRTLLKMDDGQGGLLVNNGNYYAANFDKPHAFNFTGNYKFKHRYNLSINVTYSTGRPITLPIAKYNYGGADRVYYSDRNAYRIPDYFRTDISFNIEGNHKVNQLTHNSWTIGVYNITGRQNAYSTYFTTENGVINGYKLSIFATALPFINYNIKF